jgi:hypothetical protein
MGGYFGSEAVAEAFIQIGVRPLLPRFGTRVRMADFGGGQGFLAARVRDFLTAQGFQVQAVVVDANPDFLRVAASAGLEAVQAELSQFQAEEPFDLVIMRAVLHYNPYPKMVGILRAVRNCLADDGVLLEQTLSGTVASCNLRREIVSLPSLGERIADGYYNFNPFVQVPELMSDAGFSRHELLGMAPDLVWTLGEQWQRFNRADLETLWDIGSVQLHAWRARQEAVFCQAAIALIESYESVFGLNQINVDMTDRANPQIHNAYPIYAAYR